MVVVFVKNSSFSVVVLLKTVSFKGPFLISIRAASTAVMCDSSMVRSDLRRSSVASI